MELDRLRREGQERPPHADHEAILAWLAEHRLRWAREGREEYRNLLPKA